jgi:transcriptional regulator with XRE-family HTH domain
MLFDNSEGLSVKVTATKDIVTERGFVVARHGASGKVKLAKPHDPCNHFKVLVLFGKRRHGYWCAPKDLISDGSLEKYIAWPPLPKKVLPVPKGDPHKYDFGSNLRIIREARGLSQVQLGKLMSKNGLYVAQSTICYRERRPDCPSGRFVNASAKALNVPAFMFFVPLGDCVVIKSAGEFMRSVREKLCIGVSEAQFDETTKRELLLTGFKELPPRKEGKNGVPKERREVRRGTGGASRSFVRNKDVDSGMF